MLQSVFFSTTSFLSTVRAVSQISMGWCHYKFLDSNLYYVLRILLSTLSFTSMRFLPSYIPLGNYLNLQYCLQILNLCLPDIQLLLSPILPKKGSGGKSSGMIYLDFPSPCLHVTIFTSFPQASKAVLQRISSNSPTPILSVTSELINTLFLLPPFSNILN